MANVQTRVMQSDDLQLLSELESEFPQVGDTPWRSDDQDEFNLFLRSLPRIGGEGVVATLDGVPAGYTLTSARQTEVGFDLISDTRVLTHIAVLPRFRRQGVGSKLLKAVVAKGRKTELALLYAVIPATRIAFYESQRWKVCAPETALSWLEAPSYELWEKAHREGANVGSTRKRSLLRVERGKGGAEYQHLAYMPLSKKKLKHLFEVPNNDEKDEIRHLLKLAELCSQDPALMQRIPNEVHSNISDAIDFKKSGGADFRTFLMGGHNS